MRPRRHLPLVSSYCRIEPLGRAGVTPVAARKLNGGSGRLVGASARARRRGVGRALGAAELAPSVRELSLELAHLVGRTRGRGRALLGLTPARFGLPGSARALRLLFGASGRALIGRALGALAAAHELQRAARRHARE